MKAVDLIAAMRDGRELTSEETYKRAVKGIVYRSRTLMDKISATTWRPLRTEGRVPGATLARYTRAGCQSAGSCWYWSKLTWLIFLNNEVTIQPSPFDICNFPLVDKYKRFAAAFRRCGQGAYRSCWVPGKFPPPAGGAWSDATAMSLDHNLASSDITSVLPRPITVKYVPLRPITVKYVAKYCEMTVRGKGAKAAKNYEINQKVKRPMPSTVYRLSSIVPLTSPCSRA